MGQHASQQPIQIRQYLLQDSFKLHHLRSRELALIMLYHFQNIMNNLLLLLSLFYNIINILADDFIEIITCYFDHIGIRIEHYLVVEEESLDELA